VNISEGFIRRPIATSLMMAAIRIVRLVAYRVAAGQRSAQRRFPTLLRHGAVTRPSRRRWARRSRRRSRTRSR